MERPTDDLGKKPPAKRPRLEQKQPTVTKSGDNDGANGANPFLALEEGPFNHVLQFLHWRDLNEFAQVSKKCQQARNNPTLDQTREGTITFLPAKDAKLRGLRAGSKISADQMRANVQNWQGKMWKYHSNTTRLVIRGLKNISMHYLRNPERCSWGQFTYFRVIDPGSGSESTLAFFILIGIAIREIEISGIKITGYSDGSRIVWPTSHLSTIRLENAICDSTTCVGVVVGYFTGNVWRESRDLREVYLDNTVFDCYPNNNFLSLATRSLRNVSCVGVKVRVIRAATWLGVHEADHVKALDQTQLMTFVRSRPELQWFRSDLTPSNIAILQQERPDVTFVSPEQDARPAKVEPEMIADVREKLHQAFDCIRSLGSEYSESANRILDGCFEMNRVFRNQQVEECLNASRRSQEGAA